MSKLEVTKDFRVFKHPNGGFTLNAGGLSVAACSTFDEIVKETLGMICKDLGVADAEARRAFVIQGRIRGKPLMHRRRSKTGVF
jgi:hypothetical protein